MTWRGRHRHTDPVLSDPLADPTHADLTLLDDQPEPSVIGNRRPNLAERGAWSIVWLALLTGGLGAWGFWWWSSAMAVLAPVMVLVGLVGIAACWIVPDVRARYLQVPAFAAVVAAVLLPQVAEINTRRYYSTDSAAFDHVAASFVLHGRDPYVASMSRAASKLLSVPVRFWTDTVSGGHVSHFSYPAGSFLLPLPALALGFHHMTVDWTDMFCWLATVALLFALLPAGLRWLAAFIGLVPMFVGGFTSGGTDAMFLPFLVLALWRWDRYGSGRRAGVARWIGPVAMGVACAVKQIPWFLVPFLAVGIYVEARRNGRPATRSTLRYLGVVVACFAAVNLPFIVWQPGDWLKGTVLPLTAGLVADGQGLVTLATHGVVGGVDLTLLSATACVALLAGLVAFAAWYPVLKRVWPVLVALPLFFSPRSLSSYLIDLVPAALMAALSVGDLQGTARSGRVRQIHGGRWSWRAAAFGVPCVAAAGLCVAAFSGPPLALTILGIQTAHGGRVVSDVEVAVHNETSAWLTPHFVVNTGDTAVGFWPDAAGAAARLGPHRTESVTLYPPVTTVAPQRGAHWLVVAYTAGPSWLSSSSLTPYPLPAVRAVSRRDAPARRHNESRRRQ